MAGTFSLSEPTIDPQLAKVLTKIALKGARVVLCTPVCNFLELGQFGSPNSKGVSKGCAWGLFGGNIV